MSEQTFLLQELSATLWRRRWLIGIVLIVGLLTTVVLAWLQAPTYRAAAKLMVTSSRATITVSPDANERPRVDPVTEADLSSESALLNSRSLLKEVLEPYESKRAPRQPPTGVAAVVDTLTAPLDLPGKLYRQIHGLAPSSRLDQWVEYAEHHLSVAGVGRSNLIEVSYEDGDPRWAAELVNSLVSHHVERHVRMNREASAQQFYGAQRELLAGKLRDAETALRSFYDREGIGSEGTGVIAQRTRVQQLEVALHDAQTGLAESSAEADYLGRALGSMPRSAGAVPVGRATGGDLIQSRLTELELQRSQLLSQYAPTSVKVADVDSQIAQARRMLAEQQARGITTSDPTRQTLEANLTQARAKTAALEARAKALDEQLTAGRSELQHLDSVATEQERLEQEVASSKQTLATYLKKEEEARFSNALDESRIVNVTVVEPATLPETPQPSKRMLMLAVGAMVSLAAGIAMAFARDRLDPSVKAASEAQRISHLPVLAEIPS